MNGTFAWKPSLNHSTIQTVLILGALAVNRAAAETGQLWRRQLWRRQRVQLTVTKICPGRRHGIFA